MPETVSDNVVDFGELRKTFRQAKDSAGQMAGALAGDGEPPDNPPMSDERIGRLEAGVSGLESAVEGLRHGQNITTGVLAALIALVGAIVAAFGVYGLQRLDAINDRMFTLNDKVNALPSQIGSDLRDLSKTIAENITAARQFPQTPPPPVPPQPQSPPAPAPPRPPQDISPPDGPR